MKVEVRVHTAVMNTFPAIAVVDGEEIRTNAPCLEVEMVTTKHRHGNMTFRFAGSEMDEAKEMFLPDTILELDISVKKSAAKKPEPKPEPAPAPSV